jgi:hypothetical protein
MGHPVQVSAPAPKNQRPADEGLVGDFKRFPTLWATRVLWLLLPATVGTTIGQALSEAARPSQLVATIGAWIIWGVGVSACFIKRPATLTALRIAAPAVLVAAIAAAVSSTLHPIAVVHAAVLTLVVLLPEVGAAMVDGISYGDERRLLLRAPLPLLLAPVPLSWIAVVAGVVSGPLLLAAKQWLAGAAALVVGVFIARHAARALYGLSKRWVIFVPNGFVVHDHLSTREPFLLRRSDIRSIGPADATTDLADADVVDATQNATGVVLLAALRKPVEVVPIGRVVEMRHVHQVAFCPTRPGALLQLARQRRVVG